MGKIRFGGAGASKKAVAKRAIERKTGARGLCSILEEVLLDTMFELPSMQGVEEVVVNGECITRKGEPQGRLRLGLLKPVRPGLLRAAALRPVPRAPAPPPRPIRG